MFLIIFMYDLDNVPNNLYNQDNVPDNLYGLDNVPDNLYDLHNFYYNICNLINVISMIWTMFLIISMTCTIFITIYLINQLINQSIIRQKFWSVPHSAQLWKLGTSFWPIAHSGSQVQRQLTWTYQSKVSFESLACHDSINDVVQEPTTVCWLLYEEEWFVWANQKETQV